MRFQNQLSLGRVYKWLWGLCILGLVFTGFGQLPIYARYKLSTLPGLKWSADFYFTHALHEVFAFLFIALAVYAIILWLFGGRPALSKAGILKLIILVGIFATGIVRVLKNFHDFYFSPDTLLVADLGHLALAVVFLVAIAITAALSSPWFKKEYREQ
ncbi:MAG: FeS-binding protein [Desulfatibacillaceae bacterium]|nr:FeS-binding protein [Desulfatibacillaceae bacterium]